MAGFKDFIDGGLSSFTPNITASFTKGLSISANFNQRLQSALTTSNLNSPLKSLYGGAGSSAGGYTYTFPSDLDATKYMRIRKVDRVTDKSKGNTGLKSEKIFILPLPNNLNPEFAVNYRDAPMGIAGAMVTGDVTLDQFSTAYNQFEEKASTQWKRFSDAMQKDGIFKGIGTAATEQEKGTAAAISGVAAITAAGAAASGVLGAGVAAAVGGVPQIIDGVFSQAGVAPNSHLSVLFDGVGFRNFTFQYRFIPKNASEAQELKLIIQELQRAMYPSLPSDNKFLFHYPDEFLIDFASAIDSNLFKMKRTVMTNMNVNYNGDGVPRFFEDGKPVVIDMSMTFREVEIVTKEFFDEVGITTSQQAAYAGSSQEFADFNNRDFDSIGNLEPYQPNPLEYAP